VGEVRRALALAGFGSGWRRLRFRGLRRLGAGIRLAGFGGLLAGRAGALLEQIGDARHPVGGDVGERLQHRGPRFQLLGVKFIVLGGLLHQAAAGAIEIVEPIGVGVFGGGLLGDLAAIFRAIELGGAQRAQLFIGLVELLLALIAFAGHGEPFAELLGEPEGVIRLVQDMEDEGGGAGGMPARQIISRPGAQLQRLRGHAFARRAESGHGGERSFFRLARARDLFTLG